MNLTSKEVIRNVTKKLKLENIRSNREQYGDYILDGKMQFTVVLPNIHGGGGNLSPRMLKVLRDSVLLGQKDYYALVKCPMKGEEYEKIIRKKLSSY